MSICPMKQFHKFLNFFIMAIYDKLVIPIIGTESLMPTSALRIADRVAADLETRILEGSLQPGDRLAPERALALEFGVSRPTLRGAIQQLVSKGMLSTRHGGGTVVTDRLDASFADPWKEMLTQHPMLHTDMLEFRHMLEGEAARLAAQRATDADLVRIDAAFGALEIAYDCDDLAACIQADVDFHQALAEASHNVLIGHLSASLLRVIHDHVASNLTHLHAKPAEWSRIRAQHRAIWESVRSRNAQASMQDARDHLDFVRQSMVETLRLGERSDSALRRVRRAMPF